MTVDDDAAFAAGSASFMDWLSSQPGVSISPTITLADLRAHNQGRGVLATRDLEPGTVLFTLPRDVLLDVGNSRCHNVIPELAELDRFTALIIALLAEGGRADSKWAPYFDILPRTFATPMFWAQEELKELAGTTVLALLGKEEAETTYREVVAPLVKKYDGVFDGCDTSLERYHRMGSLILAYSFDVEKEPSGEEEDDNDEEVVDEVDEGSGDEDQEDSTAIADEGDMQVDIDIASSASSVTSTDNEEAKFIKAMVPLADMLNGDSDLCNAKLFYTASGALEMRAVKPIPAGAQVYNTYGVLPNADLLRRYGYTRPGRTKHDVVELDMQIVLDIAGHSLSPLHMQKRIEFIQALDTELAKEGDDEDLLLDDSLQLTAITAAVPTAAMQLTHILTLPPAAFRTLRKRGLEAVAAGGLPPRKVLKNDEQRELWTKILRKKLSEYANSDDADGGVVADENLVIEAAANENLRNAVVVRLSEKKIITSALDKVQQWHASSRPTKRRRQE
ncbi:uncharacterized protein V1518DRAFT_283301 [Limtongia smithiae]|uniref:uncharacterized protein n=1 Tax=Limtongia smithiae TaxID=1125753 RepID=UPI0034CD041A